MKKIKIKFSGFWKGFNYKEWTIYKILTERYDVEVTDDADYVFCSCFGDDFQNYSFYEYLKYPQIRIMFSGENYIPDFNYIDYGIGLYPINFRDRYFYSPCFICDHHSLLSNIDRSYPNDILKEKPYFASFISSHESENSVRGNFFKKLCEYKRVESPGCYLNNMDGRKCTTRKEKLNFQKKCKFALCFESTKHDGFVTEKIVDAFLADAIPVYYGSDTVKDIFNPKSFINVSDFDSFDNAIAKIIELDNDDDAYLDMLRQPIFNDDDFADNKSSELHDFLYKIFDQPIEKAYRRSRVCCPKLHERYLVMLIDTCKRVDDNSIFHEKFSGREMLRLMWNLILKRLHQQ